MGYDTMLYEYGKRTRDFWRRFKFFISVFYLQHNSGRKGRALTG